MMSVLQEGLLHQLGAMVRLLKKDEFIKLILIALVRPEALPLIIENESNNENEEKGDNKE